MAGRPANVSKGVVVDAQVATAKPVHHQQRPPGIGMTKRHPLLDDKTKHLCIVEVDWDSRDNQYGRLMSQLASDGSDLYTDMGTGRDVRGIPGLETSNQRLLVCDYAEFRARELADAQRSYDQSHEGGTFSLPGGHHEMKVENEAGRGLSELKENMWSKDDIVKPSYGQ